MLMKSCSERNTQVKDSKKELALATAKKVVDSLIKALAVSATRGTDCTVLDFGELQIKCHAPKQGCKRVSYEFYGSATGAADSLGCDYTKQEAIALMAAFFEEGDCSGPLYKSRWRRLAASAGVVVRPRFARKEKAVVGFSVRGEA